MRVQGKIAIVTGVGRERGLGRAIAVTLAREGAEVVLAGRNAEGIEAVAEEIRALGRRVLAIRTDVTQEGQVNAMVEKTLAEFGRVDVLVNNAGVNKFVPIDEITPEEWDRVITINLKGTFLCTRAVLPAMKRQGSGKIISIGSINGVAGSAPAGGAHYAASKGGIESLAKTVARQMGPYGITSNVVAPGPVDTDITRDFETREDYAKRRESQKGLIPLGRICTAQDVADAVLFFASDESSYITGEVLALNGGMHID